MVLIDKELQKLWKDVALTALTNWLEDSSEFNQISKGKMENFLIGANLLEIKSCEDGIVFQFKYRFRNVSVGSTSDIFDHPALSRELYLLCQEFYHFLTKKGDA